MVQTILVTTSENTKPYIAAITKKLKNKYMGEFALAVPSL